MDPGRQKRPFCLLLAGAFLLRVACGQSADTQPDRLQGQIDALQLEQKALASEVRLIRNMLLGRQEQAKETSLTGVATDIQGAATMGSSTAKIVVVEFTDFQCPFCGRFAADTFGKIVHTYVDNEKLQYAIRNFPLDEAHPFAKQYALAAECAGDQGKFWQAHEKLFRNQNTDPVLLSRELLPIGLDAGKFQLCLKNPSSSLRIAADSVEARRLGVDATPTFFLGLRDQSNPNQIHLLRKITGAQPFLSFEQVIEYLLDPPNPVSAGAN